MLPFLFVLATYGTIAIRDLAGRRLQALSAFGLAALLVQGGLYLADLYSSYPVRAASAFDTGAVAAMRAAVDSARGHLVFAGSDLDEQPYIDAYVALLPAPPRAPDPTTGGALRRLSIVVTEPFVAMQSGGAGDIVVLPAADPAPPGARILLVERAPMNPLNPRPNGEPLIVVYRVGG